MNELRKIFSNSHIHLCFYLIFINLVFTTNIITTTVMALKCICNIQECDLIRPQDCPGKGLVVWDPCKLVYNISYLFYYIFNVFE